MTYHYQYKGQENKQVADHFVSQPDEAEPGHICLMQPPQILPIKERKNAGFNESQCGSYIIRSFKYSISAGFRVNGMHIPNI